MPKEQKPEKTTSTFDRITAPVEGKPSKKEDFDRNRGGLYGGRPEVRGGKPVGDTAPNK